jgi:hypothetical protein
VSFHRQRHTHPRTCSAHSRSICPVVRYRQISGHYSPRRSSGSFHPQARRLTQSATHKGLWNRGDSNSSPVVFFRWVIKSTVRILSEPLSPTLCAAPPCIPIGPGKLPPEPTATSGYFYYLHLRGVQNSTQGRATMTCRPAFTISMCAFSRSANPALNFGCSPFFDMAINFGPLGYLATLSEPKGRLARPMPDTSRLVCRGSRPLVDLCGSRVVHASFVDGYRVLE